MSRQSIELKSDELSDLKRQFLTRYNKSLSVSEAAQSAIKAAVQHNSLYNKTAPLYQREMVRSEWRDFLFSLEVRYHQPKNGKNLEDDILRLQKRMNERHQCIFRKTPHPKFKTDPGFRISHAQKSISVFLKHLWCLGLIPEPPHCPVDRLILKEVGLKYPDTKWGYVNNIGTHRNHIKLLSNVAYCCSLSLAEWELKEFKLGLLPDKYWTAYPNAGS